MKVIVQKFGGTSVSSPEKRREAASRIIHARHQGYHPVVVVSAIGRKGEPYATDTLIQLAREIDPESSIEKRELDLLMACGEIISTALMAHTIRAMSGLRTIALTGGQAGILTNYEFGSARILRIDPTYVLHCLKRGLTPVVAGFQGVTEPSGGMHGAITTLGRGGSDTTASALGAALHANAVEIYTDVEGVMTADPRIVGKDRAKTLKSVSYEEICEMAHLGAKVVHPRAAEIAMIYSIPLWVKTASSDAPGTLIASSSSLPREDQMRITGVTHSPPVTHMRLTIDNADDQKELELEIYKLMGEAGVSIYFVTRSERTFEFVISRDQLRKVQEILDGLVIPVSLRRRRVTYILCPDPESAAFSTQYRLLSQSAPAQPHVLKVPIGIGESCTIVSVVAGRMSTLPGIMASICEALYDGGIPILQTADSDNSISCLINEEDTEKAVKALHEKFGLGR